MRLGDHCDPRTHAPEIWGQIVGVQNCNGALKDKYHLMFRQERYQARSESGYSLWVEVQVLGPGDLAIRSTKIKKLAGGRIQHWARGTSFGALGARAAGNSPI